MVIFRETAPVLVLRARQLVTARPVAFPAAQAAVPPLRPVDRDSPNSAPLLKLVSVFRLALGTLPERAKLPPDRRAPRERPTLPALELQLDKRSQVFSRLIRQQ